MRAAALARVLVHDGFPDQVRLDAPAEDLVVQLEVADLLVVAVDDPWISIGFDRHPHAPAVNRRPPLAVPPKEVCIPTLFLAHDRRRQRGEREKHDEEKPCAHCSPPLALPLPSATSTPRTDRDMVAALAYTRATVEMKKE